MPSPPGGWQKPADPDRLVKTHCCFGGGAMRYTAQGEARPVIGFEPWEEFPLNRGMLCPKGVKRYLQGSHPDRLLTPLIRTASGFRAADWPEALDLVVKNIERIQDNTVVTPWRCCRALRSQMRRPTYWASLRVWR